MDARISRTSYSLRRICFFFASSTREVLPAVIPSFFPCARVFNIIILGVLLAATNVLRLEDIKNAMEMALGKKFDAKPELRELNYKALEMGMEMVKVGAKV